MHRSTQVFRACLLPYDGQVGVMQFFSRIEPFHLPSPFFPPLLAYRTFFTNSLYEYESLPSQDLGHAHGQWGNPTNRGGATSSDGGETWRKRTKNRGPRPPRIAPRSPPTRSRPPPSGTDEVGGASSGSGGERGAR